MKALWRSSPVRCCSSWRAAVFVHIRYRCQVLVSDEIAAECGLSFIGKHDGFDKTSSEPIAGIASHIGPPSDQNRATVMPDANRACNVETLRTKMPSPRLR